jgi:hypothetical protein
MTNIAVVNFNTGEVTPNFDARKDTGKYTGACRKMENMIPDVYGNAVKRPGTELIVAGNGAACYYERPASDPSKIGVSTPAELQLVGSTGSSGDWPDSGDYELRSDLDMSSIAQFIPISANNIADPFTGTFDGRYFTISNLTIINNIGSKAYVGLFGLCLESQIANIILTNVSLTIPSTSPNLPPTGCLIGQMSGDSSTVTNCYASGAIQVDELGNTVPHIAGLIGVVAGDGVITRCGADTTITRTDTDIRRVGSLIGRATDTASGGATITDCYGTCTYVGIGVDILNAGGLGGSLDSVDITNCYSAISYTGDEGVNVGGFIGFDGVGAGQTNTYSNCFWDGDIVGFTVDDIGNLGDITNVTESTTAQMMAQATFTGWDFNTVWNITEGSAYPTLQWHDLVLRCKAV